MIKEKLQLTVVWAAWRFSAPQAHWQLVNVWFCTVTSVLKIATFAKSKIVLGNYQQKTTSNE